MSTNAFPVLLADWDGLLTEVRATSYDLPQLTSLQSDLERAVEKALALKAQQGAHEAARQQATQELYRAVAQSRDAASRLRSYLKGCLGPRNTELARFGVAPLGKRG